MTSEARGVRPHATARPGELATGSVPRILVGLARGVAPWSAYLMLAIRYGGPALIMSLLLIVGFTQQVRPPVTGASWGDVYRYQCFATAFWSGRPGWLNLPPQQCGAVLDTLAYNIFTLPQSHVVPDIVQQWMILHSPLVARFHTLPLEYPLLSLVPFSLPLLVPAPHYALAFAAEMLVVALGVYALIARVAGWRSAVFFALVMGLGAYATGLARFDLVPAALTFAALLLAERRRWTPAYVLLALATCMKIYPVLLVGPLLLAQLRAAPLDLPALRALLRHPRDLARRFAGLGWFIGGCLFALAVSVAINPIGTYRQVSVLGHRPLEVESVGASLVWLGTWIGFPMKSFVWFGSDNVSSALSSVVVAGLSALLLVSYLYVLFALWRSRVTQAQAWLAILLLLVLSGKLFSAQYLMWVIPFAVYLIDFSGIVPLLWMTAAALTTFSFPFLWRSPGGWHAIIALRNLVIVALTALALHVDWRAARRHVALADAPTDQERQLGHVPGMLAQEPGSNDGAAPSPLAAGIGGEP